nr:DUF445 family protein [uncultured Niameybacter sp.]
MTLEFLMAPLVGGLIGYITNGIAIKMLFRPLKPIYIGKKPIPFTQGLIPKERDRIAKSVGRVVGGQLIEAETLKQTLLSREMCTQLEGTLEEWFINLKQSKKTVRDVLNQLDDESQIEKGIEHLKKQGSHKAYEALMNLELEKTLSQRAIVELKGSLGLFAAFMNDSIMTTMAEKIESMIYEMIANEAEQMIYEVIDKEGDKCLDYPIGGLAKELESFMPSIKKSLMKQYANLVEKQLAKWLQTLNISQIVEDKIKSLDLLELEEMILDIMRKELRAIVWLGAVLGAIMGLVMNLF